jgi:hypothetical protein
VTAGPLLPGRLRPLALTAAMVGLGAHYFTDAIGGTATGTAVPLGCALILDRIAAPSTGMTAPLT